MHLCLKKNIIYRDYILKALFLLALRLEVLIVLKERSYQLQCPPGDKCHGVGVGRETIKGGTIHLPPDTMRFRYLG